MTVRPLLSPEEIALRAGQDPAFLRLPDTGSLFAERALRLRRLAAGHAMRDYLMLMAETAEAQHQVLQRFGSGALGPVALPSVEGLQQAAARGVAPLPADGWARDPAWRDGLAALLQLLAARAPTGPVAEAIARLQAAAPDILEQQADRLLTGVMLGLDLATAPLLGAALQVYWVHLVAAVQHAQAGAREAPFGRIDQSGHCPCCGSRPTASITRQSAAAAGQRYLHCALCEAEWHLVRITCAHCGATEDLYYEGLEPQPGVSVPATAAAPGAVRAECCGRCGHYLKILHTEKDTELDPVADDLASITLDLLVSSGGLQRHGINLMLLFGDPDVDPAPAGEG